MTKELIERLRNHANWECRDTEAADAIESLQAENERLKAERERNLDSIRVNNEIISKKNAERDALAAKLATLEADAGRYRCIRNPPYSDQWGDVYAMTFQRTGDMVLKGEELDRVADAAIDAAKGGQQ